MCLADAGSLPSPGLAKRLFSLEVCSDGNDSEGIHHSCHCHIGIWVIVTITESIVFHFGFLFIAEWPHQP